MSKKIFFYCNIEIDFMILASIAKIIKQNQKDYKLIFIESNHPRIKDGKMSDYYNIFDKVISLKYFVISSSISNILTSIKNIFHFKNELKKINVNKNDMLFTFDIFKYTDLLVFDFFKKKEAKVTVISAFVGKRFSKENLYISWLPTLLNTFYLVISNSFYLYTESKIKNTNLGGYKHFSGKPDFLISIETSSTILTPKYKLFTQLPFPLDNLLSFSNNKSHTQPSKLLLMVSTLHASRYSGYWEKIRNVIEFIPSKFDIYIKDHPQANSCARNELKNINLNYINSKSNLEIELFKNNISTVIGVGSTGLITASWMGFNVCDITSLMNYPKNVKKYFFEYLEMGQKIKKLKTFEEISNIKFEQIKQNELNKTKWTNCLNKILDYA